MSKKRKNEISSRVTQYRQRHSLLLDMFMVSDLIRTFGSMKAEPEIILIRFYLFERYICDHNGGSASLHK